jgi:diacylglycerol kinase family enzyme
MVTFGAIVNRNSGGFCRLSEDECGAKVQDMERILRCKVKFTEDSDFADVIIRKEFMRADVLAILGGDGSTAKAYNAVHPIVDDFPGHVLVSVPTGSGCAVKYEFGIPEDLAAASFEISRLANNIDEHAHHLDLLRVNGGPLSMFASIGVAPKLISRYERGILRGRNTLLGYGIAVARTAVDAARANRLHLHNDDLCRHEDAVIFRATKFRHIGLGALFAPDARHDDGQIHCATYGVVDAWKSAPSAYLGRKAGQHFSASRLAVMCDHPVPYEINGDVQIPSKEFFFELVPKAVRVLAKRT